MLRRAHLSQPDEAIKIIKEDGGVILTGFPIEQIEQVNQDMKSSLMQRCQDRTWDARYHGRIYCGLLYGLSKTMREDIILQENVQVIINHFLRTTNPPFVDLNSQPGRSTNAILSGANTIATRPGGKAQALHRDDSIWQQVHSSQEDTGYRIGSDIGMSLLVPGVKTTRENGATMFVPGSHLWGDQRQPTIPEDVLTVDMVPGEAFLFLGSALHGGGANATNAERILHSAFFCRSWVRPESNDFVWWDKNAVQKWSIDAQRLAGYVTDKMLGICDDMDPIDALTKKSTGY
ncbi:hypothetical protein BDV38DRAFT_246793 [Aspergillus pseudotamarii]|uniref:Phytanoyl-CoA dioxygenase family protein n=1 Tax=Aspergillus pseudotamarii TaxID=132259 RepID=A0A5N6SWF3_ASPPS|nr:uncharacterized protein BDV38DRAFT_246793 [Aspergillus pseudotamarii]KAE8137454.1 hypothetical protein BDV38DRAFT_246793 [Aspergillus pseudotamarii]